LREEYTQLVEKVNNGVGLNGRDLRPEAKTEEVLQDIIFSVIELVHACLLIRTFRRNLKRFEGRGKLRSAGD